MDVDSVDVMISRNVGGGEAGALEEPVDICVKAGSDEEESAFKEKVNSGSGVAFVQIEERLDRVDSCELIRVKAGCGVNLVPFLWSEKECWSARMFIVGDGQFWYRGCVQELALV